MRDSGVVVPNLNVGWRAPGGDGAEQAVQGLDVGARACWEVGVGGGLEERSEERGLCDGQLGVGSHDGGGRVVVMGGRASDRRLLESWACHERDLG